MSRLHHLSLVALAILLFCSPVLAADKRVHLVNKVAAVVNGEMISMFDLQRYALQEITRQGLTGNDPLSERARMQIFHAILDNMIMDILIRQEAARFQVSVSDAEVDNELRMLIQQSQMTQKQFEDQLIIQGTSMKQAKEQIAQGMLRQRMMNIMVSRKIMVTKEEVERYYQEHKQEFTTQHSVDISMIIFPPVSNPEAVRQEIANGAISFADAARKYSTAPNAANGGKMGAIPWADLNPDWKTVLAGMQSGEVSQVLTAGNVSLLLQLNSTIEDTVMSLEEVAPQIENILREPKLKERFDEYSRQLRSNAVVDIRI